MESPKRNLDDEESENRYKKQRREEKKWLDDVVRFNVGGTIFTTTRSTIMKYPKTKLAAIIAPDSQWNKIDNIYFIDRTPLMFTYVLEYYRNDRLHTATDICNTLGAMHIWRSDVAFYGLDSGKAAASHMSSVTTLNDLGSCMLRIFKPLVACMVEDFMVSEGWTEFTKGEMDHIEWVFVDRTSFALSDGREFNTFKYISNHTAMFAFKTHLQDIHKLSVHVEKIEKGPAYAAYREEANRWPFVSMSEAEPCNGRNCLKSNHGTPSCSPMIVKMSLYPNSIPNIIKK